MNKYPVSFSSGSDNNLDYYLRAMMHDWETAQYYYKGSPNYIYHAVLSIDHTARLYRWEKKKAWLKKTYDKRMMTLDEVAELIKEDVFGGDGFLFDGTDIIIADDYLE